MIHRSWFERESRGWGDGLETRRRAGGFQGEARPDAKGGGRFPEENLLSEYRCVGVPTGRANLSEQVARR